MEMNVCDWKKQRYIIKNKLSNSKFKTKQNVACEWSYLKLFDNIEQSFQRNLPLASFQ